jgi:Tol biopolymer transport system component
LVLAAGGTAALANPGDTIRVSVSSSGAEGDDEVDVGYWNNMSADGRFFVFSSYATNMVAGDTNGNQDVFVHDRLTGTTVRASVDADGAEHAGASYCNAPTISNDGRFVVFDTDGGWASIPGDDNFLPDVYLKDLTTGALTWVSQGVGGVAGDAQSFSGWVSGDGNFVAFESTSTNLIESDTNNLEDVFRWQRSNGTIVRASVDASGNQANGDSFAAGISYDGRYICFDSNAINLVTGDNNFLDDTFRKDMNTGEVLIASVPVGGGENAGGQTLNHGMSQDGNRVCFLSDDPTNRTGTRRNGMIRDIAAGVTYKGSVGDGNVEVPGGSVGSIAISPDGLYFSFRASSDGYVAGDTNGVNDAFVLEIATGRVQIGSVDSAGNSHNGTTAAFTTVSNGGRFQSFYSDADNLVPNDTNGFVDQFAHEFSWEQPPACDPDYNCDGNADQDDVAWLINAIASGNFFSENCGGEKDPDFNSDGNADQDDVAALINTIASTVCP